MGKNAPQGLNNNHLKNPASGGVLIKNSVCMRQDSNLGPVVYKTTALPTELRMPI